MKKIFVAATLTALMVFLGGQSGFAQNINQFVPLTTYDEFAAVVRSDIDFLALRSGPSVNYSEILRIPPGARITVVRSGAEWREEGWKDYDDNFVSVIYNGYKGYSHRGYITILQYIRGRA